MADTCPVSTSCVRYRAFIVLSRLMTALELKVPPVAVVLVFAGMMWLASRYETSLVLAVPWHGMLAVMFVIIGIAISLAGVIQFHRAKTTVHPVKLEATTAMVTSGVYRFSRNPMYLGFLLALMGWATWLSHGLAFIFLPFFVLYIDRFQIMPEERTLAAKFGGEFIAYQNSVRRWL